MIFSRSSLLAALVVAAAGGSLAAQPSGGRIRVLVLTGQSDLPAHDWRSTTPALTATLESTGRFDVRVEEEPRELTSSALAACDLLVLNYNGPRWGAEAETAVERFLRAGQGMVAVHGISYGAFFGMERKPGSRWFYPENGGRGWLAYPDIIGMTWALENIGHAARHVFTVQWTDRQHPISRGLEATFRANDELYHRIDLKPNVHVLATAFDDPKAKGTGQDEPIIWTVPFGQGRVVHITLGHDAAAIHEPGFAASFARCAEWAATGAVTLLPPRAAAAGFM